MPPKKNTDSLKEQKKLLRKKIADIHTAILKAESNLRDSKNLDKDIDKSKSVLLESINELRVKASQNEEAAEAINIGDEIERLVQDVEFPNLRQQHLHPVQQEARDAAAEVVTRWERVTPGVSLNDLPEDARILLQECTTQDWSPFPSVLHGIFGEYSHTTAAHINVAIALFQANVPQYCGLNIPTQDQVERNIKNVKRFLEALARVVCNESKKGYNPIFVFAEAAFNNPVQVLKDALGGGFALGTLIEMAGPATVSALGQLRGAALSAGQYVATNPLASFTTYQVTMPYIKGLIQQVLGERFGVNFGNRQGVDHNIETLFEQLSEYYSRRDVTDIIGFPPADVDSVRNKLSQLLYQLGDRSLRSLQSTGSIVSKALRFPGELCESVMSTVSAIDRWWCDKGTQLVDRYQFIPQGTEEGLFEALLHLLSVMNLNEDPDIIEFVSAFIKFNQPTTVFLQSVKYHMAQDVLKYRALVPPGNLSDSVDAQASDGSQTALEEVGREQGGSDNSADPWHIYAKRNMPSSDAAGLADLRTRLQPTIIEANRIQEDARKTEQERRLAANQGDSAQGGRSRSRKRSVSKRTRRKGVAKKQKSKKNKRQSRRKVRRTSSRKGRK
jgi:hypothetical protein